MLTFIYLHCQAPPSMFCRGRYKNSVDWLIDWLIVRLCHTCVLLSNGWRYRQTFFLVGYRHHSSFFALLWYCIILRENRSAFVYLSSRITQKLLDRFSRNSVKRTGGSWAKEEPVRSTQPCIPPGSVNEYQLQLGRQRQVWLIPLVDETQGVQVKLSSLDNACYTWAP